jgi:pSer/pThr/pTyr-binding forkhead associated (FHA) protein
MDLSKTVPDPPRFALEPEPAHSPAPQRPAPPPVAPALPQPIIAPAKVMDLGIPQPVPAQRLCPRCRGPSDSNAQFCRFCGASLAEAPSFPIQPASDPIAGAPSSVPSSEAPTPPRSITPVARIVAVSQPAPMPAPGPAYAPSPGQAAPAIAASTSRARLVLIARDGGEGPSFPLGETTDIGRTEGHILIAEDRYISPRHARITLRAGAFYLRDLDSTNGMFVRIPFPRGGGEGAAAERGTSAGERAAQSAAKAATAQNAENASVGEQALTDQDLFLVGQQVLRFEVVKNAEEGFGVASENGTLLFGTPAAPRYARLSQRTVEGVVRDVFHLRKAETIIGREQGDIVFTDDPFLSRRHCAVRVQQPAAGSIAGRFALVDLGSSNGTFLQVREEVRLRHGDHFRIGQQLFRFDT